MSDVDNSDLISNFVSQTHKSPNSEYEPDKLRNKIIAQDTSERKVYANRLFTLVSMWLIFVAILLVMQGLKKPCEFNLETSILISLLGSALATVLALFNAVNKYLFSEKHIDNNKIKSP